MVNIFFVIKGKLIKHECENEIAQKYGDFLNYPYSHMQIWDKHHYKKYHVDFDYFPRGRVIYNIKENYKICTDYHYKCHNCNKNYIT